MTAFYNEIDNYAADWLENLIAAGEIAPGVVDRRPIQEIEAYELAGFTQCHFFAGIGVWSGALRAIGWPDDRPIWTGSCPCQPFSAAGKQKGFSDERHLWPAWFNLIAQQKPDVIVGEQVDGAFDWIDLVSSDMEKENYAFGTGIICAAGFEGAHIRHRNYFVALANSGFSTGKRDAGSFSGAQTEISRENRPINGDSFIGFADGSDIGRLADDDNTGSQGWNERGNSAGKRVARPGVLVSGLDDDASARRTGALGNAEENSRDETRLRVPGAGCESSDTHAPMLGRNAVDWLYCRDGKWRPVEPGTFPLVNETSARVGRLRAYGNALDFETAKAFCQVVKEICDGV